LPDMAMTPVMPMIAAHVAIIHHCTQGLSASAVAMCSTR
jgi:hypothetical protein